jgi:hypothetical protein
MLFARIEICLPKPFRMLEPLGQALHNWIPYKLMPDAGECRWLYLGDHLFTHPFFDETVTHCRQLPANSSFFKPSSSAELLPPWAEATDSIAPTAIIFHVSRCGSTLVSQLLCEQAANIVLSEVPFLDALLREGHRRNDIDAWLPLVKAAVGLLGAKRRPEQRHLFIKADSWHVLFYQQWRQLYPQTPIILLYRSPDEVMRSQQRRRGMHAVPGVLEPSIFGWEHPCTNQDEYLAQVLDIYFQRFAQILATDPLALAVSYHEGMLRVMEKIAAFTGVAIGEEERQAMEQRAEFHAKFPGQVFAEPASQEAPPAFLNDALEGFRRVEALRLAQKDKVNR